MILTGTRRLLELPIQPNADGAPTERLCPAQLFTMVALLCIAGEFTAVATLATDYGLRSDWPLVRVPNFAGRSFQRGSPRSVPSAVRARPFQSGH
jgi:hypothetical protein